MAKIMLNDATSHNCCVIAQPMSGASSKRNPVRAFARLSRVWLEGACAFAAAGLLMSDYVCSLVNVTMGTLSANV